jgi:phage terminase large subunit GpA-like protein
MMASTVAEIAVATLKASGVQRVYGIPGDSLTAAGYRCSRSPRTSRGTRSARSISRLIDLAKSNLRDLEVE